MIFFLVSEPSLCRPSTVKFSSFDKQESLDADAQSVAPMFQSQLGGVPLKDHKIPAQDDRQNVVQSSGDSKSAATSPKMQPVNKASQPPAPKQRKTNSALFRALEQPYECSPSATGTPEDSSPDLAQMNGNNSFPVYRLIYS